MLQEIMPVQIKIQGLAARAAWFVLGVLLVMPSAWFASELHKVSIQEYGTSLYGFLAFIGSGVFFSTMISALQPEFVERWLFDDWREKRRQRLANNLRSQLLNDGFEGCRIIVSRKNNFAGIYDYEL